MTISAPHPSPPQPAPDGGHDPRWLERTLGRLLYHVRTLVRADGATFLRVDRELRHVEPLADWFASADLRAAIQPAGRRP